MAALVAVNCTARQISGCCLLQRPALPTEKRGATSSSSCSSLNSSWVRQDERWPCRRRRIARDRGHGGSSFRRRIAAVAKQEDGSVGTVASSDVETAVVTSALISDPTASVVPILDAESEGEGVADKEISASAITPGLAAIYNQCRIWEWRGHAINYAVVGQGPPVLLVHGFGASIGHFRRNIPVLSEKHTVFAIDLLGLGASAKPDGFVYTMEAWGQLLMDFLNEVVKEPAVIVGNSIGSLACLIASAEAREGLVKGTVLVNCAGGMNNKAIVDDWRIRLALPIFWLIDFLLLRPSIASSLFRRFRSASNVRTILQSVYSNKDAVDDELLEVILKPSDDPGALHCFVSVITGPPGPRPEMLIPKISNPILILWGDEDPFTPMDGPVGRYFLSLPQSSPTDVEFKIIESCGHCPHDDRPDLVHAELLPWLEKVHS